jgi:hypothetical protein
MAALPTNLNVTDFTAGAGGDKIDLMTQLSYSTSYADGNPSARPTATCVIEDGMTPRSRWTWMAPPAPTTPTPPS